MRKYQSKTKIVDAVQLTNENIVPLCITHHLVVNILEKNIPLIQLGGIGYYANDWFLIEDSGEISLVKNSIFKEMFEELQYPPPPDCKFKEGDKVNYIGKDTSFDKRYEWTVLDSKVVGLIEKIIEVRVITSDDYPNTRSFTEHDLELVTPKKKFKEGDEVVYIGNDPVTLKQIEGSKLIFKTSYKSGEGAICLLSLIRPSGGGYPYHFLEKDLELASKFKFKVGDTVYYIGTPRVDLVGKLFKVSCTSDSEDGERTVKLTYDKNPNIAWYVKENELRHYLPFQGEYVDHQWLLKVIEQLGESINQNP